MVVGVLVGAAAVFTGTSWLMLVCLALLMTGYLASAGRSSRRPNLSDSTGSETGGELAGVDENGNQVFWLHKPDHHRPLYWDGGDRS